METPTANIKNSNNNNHADNHNLSNNNNNANNNPTPQPTTIQSHSLTITAQPFTPASRLNNNNHNNNSNNNGNSTNSSSSSSSLTIQHTSNTIATAQPYTPVPTAGTAAGHHPIYNPAIHSPNVFVPAPGVHHQAGPMYAAMMPAQIPSNVYVNNVTANVNLHGWTHSVPTYIPGGTPHYIHGDVAPDQNQPVMQALPGMPVTLAPSNALVAAGGNGNHPTQQQIGSLGSNRGTRRGRGRTTSSSASSRRSDYNSQRHPPSEGSPAPQQLVQEQMGQQQQQQQQQLTPQQQHQQQQQQHAQTQSQQSHAQQQIDSTGQLITSGGGTSGGGPATYATAPAQYAHPPAAYATYPYQAYFATQNPMLHPAQAAAQQATGAPLYVSHMPMYNAHHVYNYMGGPFVYPPVMNPPDYQYISAGAAGDDGSQCGDERQNPDGSMVAPMWHAQAIYAPAADEYGMNPADMHGVGAGDDLNHNASSLGSGDTPSMLSPNYAIYDPQMHDVQQHMSMMHIYDETQMAQMQGMHPGGPAVTQLEDELSECGGVGGTQPGSIQMVTAGTMMSAGPIQMSNETTQMIHHGHGQHAQHQTQHIMQNAAAHHSSADDLSYIVTEPPRRSKHKASKEKAKKAQKAADQEYNSAQHSPIENGYTLYNGYNGYNGYTNGYANGYNGYNGYDGGDDHDHEYEQEEEGRQEEYYYRYNGNGHNYYNNKAEDDEHSTTSSADDISLRALLEKFELECILDDLMAAQVTYRCLKYINEEDLKEAIPHLGLRVEFREKLFAWRKKKFGIKDKSISPSSSSVPSSSNNKVHH